MLTFEVFRFKAEKQGTVTLDLQTVVVDSQAYRASGNDVIAVTESVYQRLPQCLQGEKRLVLPLKKSRHNSPRDRQMTPKEEHRSFEKRKGMPLDLTLVKKFGLIHTSKPGHPQLALGIIGHESLAEEDDSGGVYYAVREKPKSAQDIGNIVPDGLR